MRLRREFVSRWLIVAGRRVELRLDGGWAEVYGVAVGTPVALRAPSVPTALTHGDETTLKTPVLSLTMGRGICRLFYLTPKFLKE